MPSKPSDDMQTSESADIATRLIIEISDAIVEIFQMLDKYDYASKSLYLAQECLIALLVSTRRVIKMLQRDRLTLIRQASQTASKFRQSGRELSTHAKQINSNLYGEAENLENLIGELQYAQWLLRYVGDGIAWHAIGFDRSLVRTFGAKEAVGLPSEGDLIKYRDLARKIRRATKRAVLPLIHDLTNCLRTDDISLIQGGQIYSAELKISPDGKPAKANDPRSKRQKARREKISRYLETGDMGVLYPERIGGKLYKSDVLQFHNFRAIAEAISKARESGYGFTRPENSVLYVATISHPAAIEDATDKAIAAYPDLFNTLFTFRSIIPREFDYHDTLPVTAMELSADDILDILYQRIGVVVFVNYELLQGEFALAGHNLKIKHIGKSTELTVEGPPSIGIEQGTWDKVMLEGFSVKSLIEQITELKAITASGIHDLTL